MDDTQAYIRVNCKEGNPVSASEVGGNSPWQKIVNCSSLEGPCVSGDLHKKHPKNQVHYQANGQIMLLFI